PRHGEIGRLLAEQIAHAASCRRTLACPRRPLVLRGLSAYNGPLLIFAGLACHSRQASGTSATSRGDHLSLLFTMAQRVRRVAVCCICIVAISGASVA